jgi:hypothetical protein
MQLVVLLREELLREELDDARVNCGVGALEKKKHFELRNRREHVRRAGSVILRLKSNFVDSTKIYF